MAAAVIHDDEGKWLTEEAKWEKGARLMIDPAIRERVIHFVIAATQEVFSTMLGMEVQAGEAVDESAAPSPKDGVVSLVGLGGPWKGTGSICCSPAVACKIADALLMAEHPGVDDEVLDAVAEVTNMVIGNVKSRLEEEVGAMYLSIPTVIYGRNFATKSVGQNSWTLVPFTCGEWALQVQICLIRNQEGQHPKLGFTNPQLEHGG